MNRAGIGSNVPVRKPTRDVELLSIDKADLGRRGKPSLQMDLNQSFWQARSLIPRSRELWYREPKR